MRRVKGALQLMIIASGRGSGEKEERERGRGFFSEISLLVAYIKPIHCFINVVSIYQAVIFLLYLYFLSSILLYTRGKRFHSLYIYILNFTLA